MNDATGADLLRSRLDRGVAKRLAADEYETLAGAIAALTGDDWSQPTDCPGWDVRQLACHVVGMAEMVASIGEAVRQYKLATVYQKAHGGQLLDALTAIQVSERDRWTAEDVVGAALSVGPRAARMRRLTPSFVRRRRMPFPQIVNGESEDWSLGYLIDTILTRDPWMHRIDLAQATARPLVLTADHDGVIVADVVADWAARHGSPYELMLTGPAGGRWSSGINGESIEMEAIEFCRIVSGRAPGTGLLATQVPF